jgi:hypothetical protein
LEPLLELLLLELLLPLLDEPFEELPLDEPPERDTPEDEPPEFPELEERRGALVELPLDPREEEPWSFELAPLETFSLSELLRFEERRSEEVAGGLASVGVSRVAAGRATELPPVFGKLTTPSERGSEDAPRLAERRPSLEEPVPSVRVSRIDSVSVRRVRR